MKVAGFTFILMRSFIFGLVSLRVTFTVVCSYEIHNLQFYTALVLLCHHLLFSEIPSLNNSVRIKPISFYQQQNLSVTAEKLTDAHASL